MYETGCSGLVHWNDPEGWDGEVGSGWGTHVYPWLINVTVWQKPLQYCKVISLQLKKLFLSALKASMKFTKTQPSDWEKILAKEAMTKG